MLHRTAVRRRLPSYVQDAAQTSLAKNGGVRLTSLHVHTPTAVKSHSHASGSGPQEGTGRRVILLHKFFSSSLSPCQSQFLLVQHLAGFGGKGRHQSVLATMLDGLPSCQEQRELRWRYRLLGENSVCGVWRLWEADVEHG
ncbi:hypothetical protein NDU88_009736 [Pleurodeles waltl]|uniref:Uncharacterized protein n=1 Tax=Pleurodeles waltl TaxID=8319 RepID=A0AAV7QSG3_PLEWA|nr:hypothetical protein NDU88_009736 [Pleurodeles waltl]